ncbi:hypothetical protein BKA61DRAFT_627338 [Leptodontidium sp. MPI-SDFR-AT-0119]|nr:hypothetical protein BKA61DRAFT_627338 [Leptodontidium sp. MPI-SDFR-AT-0119]
MNHLLVRKKSSSSLRDARYETILATKGSFMGKSELGAIATKTCEMVRNKNEARVVRDISLLIVPPVEILAIRGAKHLKILIESVNGGWNNSIPITKTCPQPDYSVVFRRGAFTEDQLKRIEPFVGELTDTSFFIATYSMYFPFLTCEAKCGAAALDIADRQNVHSIAIAVRGIIELFRLVKREKELHREILAFSISHDHSTVRIYGHYPMPTHLKRICSVIDALPPDINFEVSQSEPRESGLSQELES